MPMNTVAPRTSGWDWLQAVLLALNLVGTTLALGGYLRGMMLWSVALTAVTVGLKLARGAVAAEAPRWHPAGWWGLPFLLFAALNVAVVTPVGWLGWWDWLGWAQLLAAFWLMLDVVAWPGPRRLLRATVLALGVALTVLGCYQRWGDPQWMMLGRTQSQYFIGRASGAFGIPNSMAAFLILLIPVTLAAALRREASAAARWGAAGLTGIFALGLVLTLSRGPWLALGLALAVGPWLGRGRPLGWRLRRAGATLAGLLALGAVLYAAVPAARQRLDALVRDRGEKTRPILWRAAVQLWRSAPLAGTGGGSYNVLFERHRPERFWDEPQWAHNDYLNTLSDYGAIGVGLAALGVAGAAWTARRNRRPDETDPLAAGWGWGTGLGAFALALTVDFHLKLPALALVLAWAAAERVGGAPAGSILARRARTVWGRTIWAGAALVVFAGTAGRIVPQARAETLRDEARRQINRLARAPLPPAEERALLAKVRPALAEAVRLDPRNAQAWADLAYGLALTGRLNPPEAGALAVEAEAAARRALAGSEAVPEFWWRLGVALDMQGRWPEGGVAFGRSVTLAPNLPQAWYYTAYHFGLRPATRPMGLAAVATCLRLDPWFPGAEPLREQLMAPH
jgi:O-antigen ligase